MARLAARLPPQLMLRVQQQHVAALATLFESTPVRCFTPHACERLILRLVTSYRPASHIVTAEKVAEAVTNPCSSEPFGTEVHPGP
jgi:hypothetical protein